MFADPRDKWSTNIVEALGKGLISGSLSPKAKLLTQRLSKARMGNLVGENQRVFGNKGRNVLNIIVDIREHLHDWSKGNILFRQ